MYSQCPSAKRSLWIFLFLVPFAFLWSLDTPARANELIARSVPSGPPLIYVVGFSNPPKASVFADLGYKVKSGQWRDPDDMDFADLGAELKNALAGKLADKLGHGTVLQTNLSGSERLTADDVECQKKAREAGAKFFLKGVIHHIRFQGNGLFPNYYELIVSARLVSAESGQVAWKTSHNLFPHYFSTKKGQSPVDVFEGRLIPHIADVMSARILAAVQAETGAP